MDELNYITMEELAEITNISTDTLRIYLSRGAFTKHIQKIHANRGIRTIYSLNDDFVRTLINFLLLRNKEDAAENLKNFWVKFGKQSPDEHKKYIYIEVKELKQELKKLSQNYNFLVEQYNDVLKLNKELTLKLKKK